MSARWEFITASQLSYKSQSPRLINLAYNSTVNFVYHRFCMWDTPTRWYLDKNTGRVSPYHEIGNIVPVLDLNMSFSDHHSGIPRSVHTSSFCPCSGRRRKRRRHPLRLHRLGNPVQDCLESWGISGDGSQSRGALGVGGRCAPFTNNLKETWHIKPGTADK